MFPNSISNVLVQITPWRDQSLWKTILLDPLKFTTARAVTDIFQLNHFKQIDRPSNSGDTDSCIFRSFNMHVHTHPEIFLNHFSVRFISFWVSWHENLENNYFHENKASFMRKQKWITCNPRSNWTLQLNSGGLEELLLLFHEFDWNQFCRSCSLFFLNKKSKAT